MSSTSSLASAADLRYALEACLRLDQHPCQTLYNGDLPVCSL